MSEKPGSSRYRIVTISENVPRHAALPLLLASGLLLFSLSGRHLIRLCWPSGGADQRQSDSIPSRKIRGVSGAELVVEESGAKGQPRLIFTHGWGLDRREWDWARQALSQDFQLVTWDLPGLGASMPVANGDYNLDNLAGDLEAVIAQTGNSPAILVGHSIGGMINLTFCRRYPQQLGKTVKGMVQLNTTYTNPVRTTSSPGLDQALQKPVYEPLLHVITAISPIFRLTNWLSYQSGLAHLQTASQSFAGTETREQLDFAASYVYKSSPDVVARGVLAMLHWEASSTVTTITIPVLVVAGMQDKTTAPSASDYMATRLPMASKIDVNLAAHLVL